LREQLEIANLKIIELQDSLKSLSNQLLKNEDEFQSNTDA